MNDLKSKIARKILNVCMAALLLFTLMPAAGVSAAATVKLKVVANYTTAKPGDTVTVKINISGVKAAGNVLCAGPLTLAYDSSKFEFISAAAGSAIEASDSLWNRSGAKVLLDYVDSTGGKNPLKADGTLFTVKLKVKSGVKSGSSSLVLSVAKDSIANAKLASVRANITNATVKFASSIAPASVKLASGTLKLGVKDTHMLAVILSPANATKSITYSSDNKAIASVSKDGKITALKTGTAKITAKTHNNKTVSVKVTVVAAPTAVQLGSGSVIIGVGESHQPRVIFAPSSATGSCTFTTNDKTVATVSANGTIKGVKAGSTTVTVKTFNNRKATLTVTVKAAPKSVKLDKEKLLLAKGKTYALKTTLNPVAAASFSKTFSSSNTKVATVNSAGKITAVKAGTATITVKTFNGKTFQCKVTVQ